MSIYFGLNSSHFYIHNYRLPTFIRIYIVFLLMVDFIYPIHVIFAFVVFVIRVGIQSTFVGMTVPHLRIKVCPPPFR
jgi:hypothetical protein